MIRDAGASRPLLEITLAHELVHALEDQRFGLDVPDGVPDDAALAESSLAEGTATALMIDYADRATWTSRDVLSLAEPAQDSGSLPPFLETPLLFPYLEGEEFVYVFRGERRAGSAIDSVYRFRRPRSAEQVIHPRDFALGERARAGARAAARADARAADGGGCGRRRWASSTCGCCSTSWAARGRPAAAQGWGGGRFELWRRGSLGDDCEAPCVAKDVAFMRVRWDTAADRAEAERQLVRVFEHGLHGARLGRPGVVQPRRGDRAGRPGAGDDGGLRSGCAHRRPRAGRCTLSGHGPDRGRVRTGTKVSRLWQYPALGSAPDRARHGGGQPGKREVRPGRGGRPLARLRSRPAWPPTR